MINFNSDDIKIGHIKQLLKDFNLPTYKIYVDNQEVIPTILYNSNEVLTAKQKSWNSHARHVHYIKENRIQEFVYDLNSTASPVEKRCYWQDVPGAAPYYRNQAILNHTKNLIIKNNIYDSYTHEYLGNYLRFLRDYDHLNLMSLYNCFSNRVCDDLDLTFTVNEDKKYFNSFDKAYKIYMVPVKLFKQYTIAIDSDLPVEVCCGVYGKYQDNREKFKDLPGYTYQKFNNLTFNQPITFDKLLWEGHIKQWSTKLYEMEIIQNEDDLKLFIKLPFNNKSSIVVLEGNYLNYSDSITKLLSNGQPKSNYNHSIINFEKVSADKTLSNKVPAPLPNMITAPQLLRINTGTSYPFADRLFEYLSGNTIDPLNTIPDNVKRVQKVYLTQYDPQSQNKSLPQEIVKYPGIWSQRLRAAIYEYMTSSDNNQLQFAEFQHDILGYVDKDVENNYKVIDNSTNTVLVTLRDVNLYENSYKN